MIRGHHVKFTADNEEASQQLVAEVLSKELFEERYNADKSLFTTIQNDQKTIKMRSWQFENGKYVITMYVTEGDLYYIYEIGFFDEMPSDEYLLSFGLKKYEG